MAVSHSLELVVMDIMSDVASDEGQETRTL